MWSKNGNIVGEKLDWSSAISWVKNLNYDGYNDWRLPTKEELESFSKRGGDKPSQWFNANGFNSVQTNFYWTATTIADDTNRAWSVGMGGGYLYNASKSGSNYVWPVRAGQ